MSEYSKFQSTTTQPLPSHEASSIASCTSKHYCLITAVVIAFGVLLRAWLSYKTDFSIGDSYIGFRFAEQFAAGNGLVFNVGEMVGGNTSILYSFILGLGACTGASIPLVARCIGVTCDVITFLLIQNTLKRDSGLRSPLLQIIVPALIFFCPLLFLYSVSGMETPLYILSIVFLINRTIKGVDFLWHLSMAILVFTRPDGILAISVCLLYLTIKHRKIPFQAIGTTFVMGSLYLAYNYYHYASILPLTVKTKAIVFHNTLEQNIQYISDRFFFHRQWILYVYLLLTGALVAYFRKKEIVLLSGLSALVYLLFILFAPYVRTWYAVPFLTLSACTLACAFAFLAEKRNFSGAQRIYLGIFLIYLVGSTFAFRLIFRECGIWRERIGHQQESAGNWIRRNTAPDSKIFVTALETGYFAKRHTWDHPGLVSPQVLQMIQLEPGLELLDIAARLKVDYAVLPQDLVRNSDPRFTQMANFGTKIHADRMGLGESSYTIYKRNFE